MRIHKLCSNIFMLNHKNCLNAVSKCRSARLFSSGNVGSLTLLNESERGVRTVTLNNPKKRNALSLAMIQSLQSRLQDSDRLRALIINANSQQTGVFCAGHDLKELTSETGRDYHEKVFATCTEMMTALIELPLPVICQVDGVAAAAGCQLAATCDIVIATKKSTFSTPGASMGLFCSTPGIAVSRAANLKTAAYMVLTGNAISAEEALRSGLITVLVEDEKEMQEATEKAVDAILAKSKSVIALGKRFFYQQLNSPLSEAYSKGCQVMVNNLAFQDTQEGISAFVEKRKPTWTHRETKLH